MRPNTKRVDFGRPLITSIILLHVKSNTLMPWATPLTVMKRAMTPICPVVCSSTPVKTWWARQMPFCKKISVSNGPVLNQQKGISTKFLVPARVSPMWSTEPMPGWMAIVRVEAPINMAQMSGMTKVPSARPTLVH